ncbi:MAG: AAA family ATPase [Deltaproteobacteria bacterium]|nr:AAA family ATPase [Deltaproteobacteria bacterium]
MKFSAVVEQVLELLQRQTRVSYRALKREFELDDDYVEDLKVELIQARKLAIDEDGAVLVWAGEREPENRGTGEPEKIGLASKQDAAERRQLTVMFCDLVGSTALSERLDPEELREVVRAYQETCTGVIRRYDGHIAQHLGDGLLVYFGYPAAHEDDARRAVRTGLEIIAAMHRLSPAPSQREGRGEGSGTGSSPDSPHPSPLPQGARGLQVRIGIHTGLVVIGEIGSGEKREILALGETPNIAARVQGIAEPDSVVMSAATQRLVHGLFACQDLGPQTLKGISTPLAVYRVVAESAAQSRFEAAVSAGLTPLVGREEELGLLQQRWTQANDGAGQVVLLSGEAGIGKSRLVQALKEQVLAEGATRIEFRCSPYHQNSAFYPITEHLQRLLQWTRDETPQAKLSKLQQALTRYRFPQADTLQLFAALLSLPQAAGTLSLTLSPQKQKQKTQEALVAWIVEESERATVYCAWEDLHWADPSTLEVLTLFLEQVPRVRMFAMLTFRPEFTPPWSPRSYLTPLTLSRLGRPHVEAIVERVTGGKSLPVEVVQQIVAKTDGVPLFVEELTKTVMESVGAIHELPLQLGIPATLQDALMARLDRLGLAKEIAQLGATLGREFSYELLHAVSFSAEAALQQGLRQLVEAELLYQRGLLPQATYIFKHALIQDTAYQSLLKSKRQQLHQQIAQVLADRFPETVETQPELVAHHYTEAGLKEQAIPYWQKAGQRAVQRSANAEAISHLTKGLEVLKTLPDTPERTQQELRLQLTLGPPLVAHKGNGSPEVKDTYARALELCRQLGETPQLLPVLFGLRAAYTSQGDYQMARKLAEQGLRLAQSVQGTTSLLLAHMGMGITLYFLGEFVPALDHLEQAFTLYDPQLHSPRVSRTTQDPGVLCLTYLAWSLWLLGYPEQAVKKAPEALALAQELSHTSSLPWAFNLVAKVHLWRREGLEVQEQAEAMLQIANEHELPYWLTEGTMMRGWALAEQGQEEEGITQMRQGLSAWRALGSGVGAAYFLTLPIEAYSRRGQIEEGLNTLAEAFDVVRKTGEGLWEAELYRLKGELTLQQFQVPGSKFQVSTPQAAVEAEECFLKALEVARRQQAKSLELRATVSLARLWQQQGKRAEAHQMLSEIYGWFTEGFDTKDLQEAKALIEELSH